MPFSLYRKGRKGDDTTPSDLFIATTSVSGRPCVNYCTSMIDTAVWLTENKVTFDYWNHTEDCHVDDARNFIVSEFMRSGAKTLIFIDDDVGWATEDFGRLICYKNVDVVGGAYPLKQRKEDYPIRLSPDSPVMQARADGLLEVSGVPTGFMRIERHVLEALSEKRKHMFFAAREAAPDQPKLQVIFERMMVDGHRWSGDLNFCREARLLGFKIHVAPEMTFTHQGQQRWEGNFGNYLRKKQGILDPRLDQAFDKLIGGDSSPEVFNEIFLYYAEPYSMGPKSLSEVYHRCLAAKGPILECGSGISTIIAGIACQRNGQTVHALEHDMEWFTQVRNFVNLWKVRGVALYYAPLQEYPGGDDANRPMRWYGDGVIDDLPEKFDVAIIDGPPRMHGRDGVYKLVGDKIKDALWIVDDVEDKGQQALVQIYAEKWGKKIEDHGSAESGQRHYAVVQ
jgi:hypothetical protein